MKVRLTLMEATVARRREVAVFELFFGALAFYVLPAFAFAVPVAVILGDWRERIGGVILEWTLALGCATLAATLLFGGLT